MKRELEPHLKINLDAYDQLDKDMLARNTMKYALLHSGKLIDIYNDLEDVYKIGKRLFPNRDFMIRQINAPPACFGSLNDIIITI